MLVISKKSSRGRIISGSLRLVFFSLLAAAFASSAAFAQNSTPITDCGTVITQPGSYILVNDLNCGGPVAPGSSGSTRTLSPSAQQLLSHFPSSAAPTNDPPATQDGIDIVADHVTLLLNGHTITGNTNFGAVGISVGLLNFSGNSHVNIIGPGTVTNFFIGVLLEQSSFSAVTDVTINFNLVGIVAGDFFTGCLPTCTAVKNHLQGNTVSQAEVGIALIGANDSAVRNNTVTNTGGGIVVFLGTDDDLRFNTTSGNGTGIDLLDGSTDNTVFLNTAQNNASFDLEDDNAGCDSNTWKHNTFGSANQTCIH